MKHLEIFKDKEKLRFEIWCQAFAVEASRERKAARIYVAVETAYRFLAIGLIALLIIL